jgi:hypothetical protein
LGFVKIDAVLLLVGLALVWIILETHAVWKIYLGDGLLQEIFFVERPRSPMAARGAIHAG